VNDANIAIAEIQMWQSRVGDMETSMERLREERDALVTSIASIKHREDALIERITELEGIVKRMTIALSQHRADGELYP